MNKEEHTRAKKTSKPQKLLRNLTNITLQFIQGKRFSPSSFEHLVRDLDIAPMNEGLFKEILDTLVKEKKLKIQNKKYMRPKSANLVTGIISVHHKKGFGFVKNPEGGPDVFIPKHLTMGAVDGDTVEVETNPVVSAKGPEGVIIAILKRSRSHLAGTVIQKVGKQYIAFSPVLGEGKKILVSSDKKLKEGDRIICLVTNWNEKKEDVEATLDRFMGHISDPSIDVQAAIEEFELPVDFTREATDEAKAYGKKVSLQNLGTRKDLTDLECVTIDPETARDFDDAISLELDKKGHYHLGIHIADVAHYVKSGMHLDSEAFNRCNSTYFPGKCVPMLPEELSNELCSLKPKVIRFTQSVLAEFDEKGNLLKHEIVRSAIKSRKRFSYGDAFAVLEGKKKSVHSPLLKRMVDLCHLLKAKRFDRGSIDFSMPDNVLIVDEKGEPQRIETHEYDITHQMIEEFMLKANEIVATHLDKLKKTLIFRIHEEPADESFQDFYTFARSLGFQLPSNPDHRDIQNLFKQAKDSPFISQLSIGFIRSMKLAAYSPDNIGHYGLALEHYCHFTSPIRRYTDLIIQRLLFDELRPDTEVKKIAEACSEKERVSFRAESSVIQLKKLRLAERFFKEDPAKIYSASITKIKPFALFFEIKELGLEGSFHVSEIGNDFFEYNPKKMSFRGKRTGKTFSIGQELLVRLDRIDLPVRLAVWSCV